jgi:hypothetical protein
MTRAQVFACVLAVSLINGLFSGLAIVVAAYAPLWLPFWLPANIGVILFLAILIVATTTLLAAGIPAALVEGAFPQTRDTLMPMWVWLGAALFLSWYGVIGLMRAVFPGM